jgi:hypothetical protein
MFGSRDEVRLPEDVQRRIDLWKAGGALVICAVYGWHAFVRDTQVPVLEYLDVAVHEVGHLLFRPFGELVMLIMGSGFQVMFPLVAGLAFAVWKRNWIAWGICWAWSANACADAARYIADAPRGELALLGAGPDALGDWALILGPEHFDKLFLADRIASAVRTLGLALWIAAVGVVFVGAWRSYLALRGNQAAAPRASARPARTREPVSDLDMWR